jgi:hypothetical protein
MLGNPEIQDLMRERYESGAANLESAQRLLIHLSHLKSPTDNPLLWNDLIRVLPLLTPAQREELQADLDKAQAWVRDAIANLAVN